MALTATTLSEYQIKMKLQAVNNGVKKEFGGTRSIIRQSLSLIGKKDIHQQQIPTMILLMFITKLGIREIRLYLAHTPVSSVSYRLINMIKQLKPLLLFIFYIKLNLQKNRLEGLSDEKHFYGHLVEKR